MISWDGRKVLQHLAVGDKESRACWEAFTAKSYEEGFEQAQEIIEDY